METVTLAPMISMVAKCLQSGCTGLLLLLVISISASAEPTFKQSKLNGGALQIFATNNTEDAFNCRAEWTIVGNEFSAVTPKQMTGVFFVKAHANNELVLNSGAPALTNVQPMADASISCTQFSSHVPNRRDDHGAQPQGSYKGSCNNCVVSGDMLTCGNCNTGRKCGWYGESCTKKSEVNFKTCQNYSVHNADGDLRCDSQFVPSPPPPPLFLGEWKDDIRTPEGATIKYPVAFECTCIHMQRNGHLPNNHSVTLTNSCTDYVVVFSEKDGSPRTTAVESGQDVVPVSGRQFGLTPLGAGNSVTFNVEQSAWDFHMPLICPTPTPLPRSGPNDPPSPLFSIDN